MENPIICISNELDFLPDVIADLVIEYLKFPFYDVIAIFIHPDVDVMGYSFIRVKRIDFIHGKYEIDGNVLKKKETYEPVTWPYRLQMKLEPEDIEQESCQLTLETEKKYVEKGTIQGLTMYSPWEWFNESRKYSYFDFRIETSPFRFSY